MESELLKAAGQDEIRRLQKDLAKARSRRKAAEANLKLAEKEIEEYALRQEYLDSLNSDPSSRSLTFKKRPPSGKATAVLVWTDWHIEEKVDPATVGGLNEYNPTIARKRFHQSLKKSILLLESARQISKIKNLVVAILGDMITGYIHEELIESNFLSPTEASLEAQEMIVTGLNFLLKEADVSSITVPTCYGNHGRTTQKKRISTGYKNSFEWLLYNQLATYYRNEPRIRFKIAKGYHNVLDVQGHKIRFHHGDGLKYGGGVGGITIPVLKAIAKWNGAEACDLDVFGHWHQFLFHKQFVSCNCLIGYGPYSVAIKGDFAPPTQTFIVIDRSRRSPVDVREIYCD